MPANLVSDRPPLISLLRVVTLAIVGFQVIGTFLGVAIGSLLYDGNFILDLMSISSHPEIQTAIIASQFGAAAVGLILLPVYYIQVSEKKKISAFFYREPSWLLVSFSVLVGVIGLSVAISPVIEWNMNFEFPEWMAGLGVRIRETEAQAAELVKLFTSDLTPAKFIVCLVVVAVIPGFGEELVFRGMIQHEMIRALRNPHVAIWLTAVFFSAFHLQFLGFFPRVLLGAFFGYLYYWSGNLWVPVLGHFFNNGLQVLGIYLHQQGILTFDVESTESAPMEIVGIALVLTALLLVFYKNYFLSRSTSIRDFTQEL